MSDSIRVRSTRPTGGGTPPGPRLVVGRGGAPGTPGAPGYPAITLADVGKVLGATESSPGVYVPAWVAGGVGLSEINDDTPTSGLAGALVAQDGRVDSIPGTAPFQLLMSGFGPGGSLVWGATPATAPTDGGPYYLRLTTGRSGDVTWELPAVGLLTGLGDVPPQPAGPGNFRLVLVIPQGANPYPWIWVEDVNPVPPPPSTYTPAVKFDDARNSMYLSALGA